MIKLLRIIVLIPLAGLEGLIKIVFAILDWDSSVLDEDSSWLYYKIFKK